MFLQGLLLQSPNLLSTWFDPVKGFLENYHESVQQAGLTLIQSALGFVEGLQEVDHYLIGVNDLSQLQQNLQVSRSQISFNWSEFALDDSPFLNPSLWQ